MPLDQEDRTGAGVSDRDINDAIDAVRNSMVIIHKLPPQLGANLPNIHRCLRQFQAQRAAMKLMSGG